MDYKDCWYKDACKKYSRSLINCVSCPKFIEMRSLMKQSNLPMNKWKPQKLIPFGAEQLFDELNAIKSDIKNWVEEGNNLYFYSETCGNGKTSWAIKLLQSYFDKVWAGNGLECRGIFVSVPNFIIKSKENMRIIDDDFVEMRSKLNDVDLVVWDDIATTKLTEYEHGLLLAYIDTRVLNGKANIFTGNANKETMTNYLGERLTSRVYSNSKVFKFTNRDMRGVKV